MRNVQIIFIPENKSRQEKKTTRNSSPFVPSKDYRRLIGRFHMSTIPNPNRLKASHLTTLGHLCAGISFSDAIHSIFVIESTHILELVFLCGPLFRIEPFRYLCFYRY